MAVRKKKTAKKTTARKATRAATRTRKLCVRCLETKSLDDFGKNPRMKLGRKSYCKSCSATLQREWNKKRREEEEASKRASKKRTVKKRNAKKKAARRR